MKYLFFALFLLPYVVTEEGSSTRKINLEDIEHDNIVSEKLAKNTPHKDIFEVQQSQNYHSTNLEYYRQQLKKLQELQEEQRDLQQQQQEQQEKQEASAPDVPTGPGGVVYATQAPTHQPYENESPETEDSGITHSHNGGHYRQDQHVQYVTVAPNRFQYQSAAKAVHEESSHTYSAPSRQSLDRPITPTVSAYLEQHPQPRYVYVQSGGVQAKAIQSPQNVANDIQYVADDHQHSAQHQDTITYSRDESPTEKTKDGTSEPSYQPASQDSNQIQYVPYIAQGPTPEQSYVTMVEIPSHYAQRAQTIKYTPSVITFSHSGPASVTPIVGGAHQTIQYVPATLGSHTTGALQYINSNDLQENLPEQQYQDIHYANPTQIPPSSSSTNDGSKQLKYAPKHPERPLPQENREEIVPQVQHHQQPHHPQPLPQYLPSQRVVPLQTFRYQQQPQINVQPLHHYNLDPFRQPKSLLDSYIPSWVIVERQRQRSLEIAAAQSQHYAAQQQQQQQQQYSTIAFSTQQYHGYGFDSAKQSKRSTKLTKVEKN